MGSPFETATWNGVEGAYYTGAGSGMEMIWLIASVVLCVAALVIGHRHETTAYKRAEK